MGSLCSRGIDQYEARPAPGDRPSNLASRREAVAAAAESRIVKEQTRGTRPSNPDRARLQQKLAAASTGGRDEEQLRWD